MANGTDEFKVVCIKAYHWNHIHIQDWNPNGWNPKLSRNIIVPNLRIGLNATLAE